MRFLPNGLNIPDELLEARDKGNVVFLCGAGVAYPAGMPDFLGLARYVVEELGTPQDAPSSEMLSMWENENVQEGARPSLDQIFNLLQQEYTAGEIDYLIAKRLRTKPKKPSENSGFHPFCEEKSPDSSTSHPMKNARRTDRLDDP